MKIFLIRHGEQIYPYDEQGRKLVSFPEAPLSELGKAQLRNLGGAFKSAGQSLDALYTSPFERADKSAKVLAEEMYISSIQTVDDLKDVANGWEGHTYDALEKVGGDIWAHPLSNDPESLDHEVDRLRLTLEYVLTDAQKRGYESIGIVSHGEPLCALNWCLKHEDNPFSYAEMKRDYYPQKGEALMYTLDPDLRIMGEGRIITTEFTNQTKESFRNSSKERK